MGIQHGAFGKFIGKVGGFVGVNRKGVYYIKSMPKKSTKPPTAGQIAQRLRFKTAASFIKSMKEFIDIGFKNVHKKSPYGYAMSEILANAIIGTSPDFTIDYKAVILSRGRLKNISEPKLSSNENLELQIEWSNIYLMDGNMDVRMDDRTMVAIYNTSKKWAVIKIGGANRKDAMQKINLPEDFLNDQVEVYMSIESLDNKRVSDSLYLGSMVVT